MCGHFNDKGHEEGGKSKYRYRGKNSSLILSGPYPTTVGLTKIHDEKKKRLGDGKVDRP